MALNSNALVSVDKFKLICSIETSDPNVDERIEEFINSASEAIEKYTRRKFRKPSTDYDDYIDGNGNKQMRLKYWPIVSAPTYIKYYDNTSQTYIALTSPDFKTNLTDGIITFRDGNIFDRGRANWLISYIYGYDLDDVPTDLRNACIELAKYSMKIFDENLHNVASVGYAGGSTTYLHGNTETALPPTVKIILDRYRSYRRAVRS